MINKSFIFLAGHHRSGTSLLHEILREHPLISGFSQTRAPQDEGQHLQNIYTSAKVNGGPGKYIFNKSSYMNEDHYLATEQSAAAIFQQWEQYYDKNCVHYIEKSPPNIIRTRFLQKLFPNSKFVVIFRHPLAVAYATRKMSKTSIDNLIDHTLLGYEIFTHDMPYLKYLYIFRYEDFVINPQAEIDRIYNFLDLNPVSIKHEIKSNVNDKYFLMWRKEPRQLVSKVIKSMENRAKKFGYSFKNCENLGLFPCMGEHKVL